MDRVLRIGLQPVPADDPALEERTVLRMSQVATLFAVNAATVKRWIAAGRLPAFQTPGGHYRLLESDVRKALENQGNGGR